MRAAAGFQIILATHHALESPWWHSPPIGDISLKLLTRSSYTSTHLILQHAWLTTCSPLPPIQHQMRFESSWLQFYPFFSLLFYRFFVSILSFGQRFQPRLYGVNSTHYAINQYFDFASSWVLWQRYSIICYFFASMGGCRSYFRWFERRKRSRSSRVEEDHGVLLASCKRWLGICGKLLLVLETCSTYGLWHAWFEWANNV